MTPSDAARAAADLDQARQEMARDAEATTRDEHSLVRDRLAEDRDRAAAALQAQLRGETPPTGTALLTALSAADAIRLASARDRVHAASDREHAAADRVQASLDRRAQLHASQQEQLDDLTGAHLREGGRHALQTEMGRCERQGVDFVLGFVDVDGLKALNDRDGHAAGDDLLRTVVAAMRSRLRDSDPIVRIGGDEFLCGFSNTDLVAAGAHVSEICSTLHASSARGSVSVGLAMHRSPETLEALTARADADMYLRRAR